MKIELKFTSIETIKPSSPTPPHLRKFPISLLDQLTPPVYTPIILYYTNSKHETIPKDFISKLKHSHSEALTSFYPLAWRITSNLYIDCNDQGAELSVARIVNSDSRLSEFLRNPDLKLLDLFLPRHTWCSVPEEEAPQVCVQVNVFPCGGIAIGISLLHEIIDGTLISAFLKTWAAVSRMDPLEVDHDHGDYTAASALFPCRESLPSHAIVWAGNPFVSKVKSQGRRYLFNAKAVAALKTEAKSRAVTEPSTVEAISGFIWKCLMKASRVKSGTAKQSVLSHAMNLRPRMEPPLPEYSIGNIAWKAFSCYNKGQHGVTPELPYLVELLRKSISEINSTYVEEMKGEKGFREISKWLQRVGEKYANGEPDAYSFTSWCKMGFNEVDFGCERPVWVSSGRVVNSPFKNGVLLMEAKQGSGGVEAWMKRR